MSLELKRFAKKGAGIWGSLTAMRPRRLDKSGSPNALRRKFFRGVPGGLGVLLAVQAKTALGGGTCISPSATVSGNHSPRSGDGSTCSGGWSPGYWKVPQHGSAWSPFAQFPSFDSTVYSPCQSGMKNLTLADVTDQGLPLLNSLFQGSEPSGKYGIWAVIAFPNEPVFGGSGILLRALATAWLNANFYNYGSNQFPLTPAQVVAIWTALHDNGIYCPNAGSVCWSASQVVSYFEGMYDVNVVDSPLCKM